MKKPPSGRAPAGEFPRVVEVNTGVTIQRTDLVTGATTHRANPGDPKRKPSVKVVTTSDIKPKRKVVRSQGFVIEDLTPFRIGFRAKRAFRNRKGRL